MPMPKGPTWPLTIPALTCVRQCVECRKVSYGTWLPGEIFMVNRIYACSRECGREWALLNFAEEYKPGRPGFFFVEPAMTDRAFRDLWLERRDGEYLLDAIRRKAGSQLNVTMAAEFAKAYIRRVHAELASAANHDPGDEDRS